MNHWQTKTCIMCVLSQQPFLAGSLEQNQNKHLSPFEFTSQLCLSQTIQNLNNFTEPQHTSTTENWNHFSGRFFVNSFQILGGPGGPGLGRWAKRRVRTNHPSPPSPAAATPPARKKREKAEVAELDGFGLDKLNSWFNWCLFNNMTQLNLEYFRGSRMV